MITQAVQFGGRIPLTINSNGNNNSIAKYLFERTDASASSMRSSYVKDRTISYQNNDEWCEEECDSYNYALEFFFVPRVEILLLIQLIRTECLQRRLWLPQTL